MNRKQVVVGLIAMMAGGLLFGLFMINKSNEAEATSLSNEGLAVGDPSAPHTVIEFSNFECPYCLKQHKALGPVIEELVEEGEIYYVFKPVRIDSYQRSSWIVDYGIDQEENWDVIDTIFSEQKEWRKMNKTDIHKYLDGMLEKKGSSINQQVIAEEADQLGLKTVPTMIIDGQVVEGLLTEEEFISELE